MATYKDWEIAAAATKLISEMMLVKPGENVVITTDTAGCEEIANATGSAARSVGASPTVIRYALPPAAHMEPPDPVAAAIKASDVWVEYAFRPIFYTKAHLAAVAAGTRYLNVARAQIDWFVRTVGEVDYQKMIALGDRLVELTESAETVRVTNASGTDIVAQNNGRKAHNHGPADKPGKSYMLGGQVGWCPIEETITGTIVFDGMVSYPEELTQLSSPIRVDVKDGLVEKISGDREAEVLDRWLRGFDDPNMLRLAHFTYGFNPGATLSNHIVEAERAYGVHVFGLGKQIALIAGTGWDAADHTDGVVVDPSVWLDNELLEKDGRFVHPALVDLDRALMG